MNIFTKWPKGLREIKNKWKQENKKANVIRANFNHALYLKYLEAINTKPNGHEG